MFNNFARSIFSTFSYFCLLICTLLIICGDWLYYAVWFYLKHVFIFQIFIKIQILTNTYKLRKFAIYSELEIHKKLSFLNVWFEISIQVSSWVSLRLSNNKCVPEIQIKFVWVFELQRRIFRGIYSLNFYYTDFILLFF